MKKISIVLLVISLIMSFLFANNIFGLELPYDIILIIFSLSLVALSVIMMFFNKDRKGEYYNGMCVIKIEDHKQKTDIISKNQYYFYFGFLIILLGVVFGFFQQMYDPFLDQSYAIDIWSITHLLFGLGIFIILLPFVNEKTSLIITMFLTFIYEPIEAYIFPLFGVTSEFYMETLWNQIMDVLFCWIGAFLGYWLVHKYTKCERKY